MGLRTSGVKKVKIYGPPKSLMNPTAEQLMMEDINIEANQRPYSRGQVSTPNLAINDSNRLSGISVPTPQEEREIKNTESLANISQQITQTNEQALKDRKLSVAAGMGAGALKAIGGVLNANARYSSIVGENNFNYQMAETEALRVASDLQTQLLREQTKGKYRGQEALLAAVAQGQSPTGDLATRAVNAEDVYAAENMMIQEINAAREIFGIESQQRRYLAENAQAETQRDFDVFNSVLGGVADIGMAGIGLI